MNDNERVQRQVSRACVEGRHVGLPLRRRLCGGWWTVHPGGAGREGDCACSCHEKEEANR
jgi:hypothetical protein